MFYGSTPPSGIEFSAIGVGCFVEYHRKILLLRHHTNKSQGGLWGLPAGKVESRELPHEAMHRELWEETGLLLPIGAPDAVGVVYVDLPEWSPFEFHLFKLELPYAPPKIALSPTEHDASQWITPTEALTLPDLFPHTDECIKLVYGL